MDQHELKASINAIVKGIEDSTKVDAQSPADKVFGALLLSGIAIVGELLLDVKRIADASGPPVHMHFHCPDGSTLDAEGDTVKIAPWFPPALADLGQEGLARFLAMKEANRKIDDRGPTPVEVVRRMWVDANWRAFLGEATELFNALNQGAGSD